MPAFCRSLAAPNVSNVVVLMAAMIALSKQLVTCQLGELRGDLPSSARVQRAEKFHL